MVLGLPGSHCLRRTMISLSLLDFGTSLTSKPFLQLRSHMPVKLGEGKKWSFFLSTKEMFLRNNAMRPWQQLGAQYLQQLLWFRLTATNLFYFYTRACFSLLSHMRPGLSRLAPALSRVTFQKTISSTFSIHQSLMPLPTAWVTEQAKHQEEVIPPSTCLPCKG